MQRVRAYVFAINSPAPLTDGGFLGISPDGQTQVVYQLPENLAKQRHSVLFYGAADGELNLLVKTEDGSGLNLLRYNSDAHLERREILPVPESVVVLSFGVNSEGYVLIFGYESTPSKQTDGAAKLNGNDAGKTYRAIFSPSGKLVTTLQEDKVAVDTNGSLAAAPQDEEYVQAVGEAFYWTSAGFISEIDTSGNLIRKMKVQMHASNDSIGGLRISGNVAEVTLMHPIGGRKYVYEEEYLLLNIENGEPYGLYDPPNDAPMYLACFDWREGFTFWSMSKKGVSIVHALMP